MGYPAIPLKIIRTAALHNVSKVSLCDCRPELTSSIRPTWAEVLASRSSHDQPEDISAERRGVQLTQPTAASTAVSGFEAEGDSDEWSPLHQQMLAKQQEFNK